MDAPVADERRTEELSLRELLQVLRNGKWFIAIVTLLFVIAAAGAARLSTRTYEASVVLSPVSNTPGEGALGPLTSLASQFGGLASLAGLSLSTDSKKTESVAVLKSAELTRTYIEKNDLLPVLYQSLWDPKEKKWRVSDPTKVPSLWKATRRFNRSIRDVTTDPKTGLVTLTVTWRDPKTASAWANGLVKMTNDYLRTQAIDQAERDIEYLKKEAEKTNVVEARQAIFTVLQGEITKSMLARGTDEYAFKIIDPAVAPEKPSSPQTAIWIGVALFVGLLVSVFVVLIRSALK